MKIQVLGPGCAKCKKLADITESVAKKLELDFEMEKVTDIKQIMKLGVMTTPALALDGDIKIVGKVPSENELKKILTS
jgi:small redox-active disulfide protein 2